MIHMDERTAEIKELHDEITGHNILIGYNTFFNRGLPEVKGRVSIPFFTAYCTCGWKIEPKGFVNIFDVGSGVGPDHISAFENNNQISLAFNKEWPVEKLTADAYKHWADAIKNIIRKHGGIL